MLTGTIQNDVLKEYIARGTYIYPPAAVACGWSATRFAYCRDQLAEVEHDLDLGLPHGRGRRHAGAGDRIHAGQRDRLRRGRALAAGLAVDDFAPRLSFFFVARTTLLGGGGRSSGPRGGSGRS